MNRSIGHEFRNATGSLIHRLDLLVRMNLFQPGVFQDHNHSHSLCESFFGVLERTQDSRVFLTAAVYVDCFHKSCVCEAEI